MGIITPDRQIGLVLFLGHFLLVHGGIGPSGADQRKRTVRHAQQRLLESLGGVLGLAKGEQYFSSEFMDRLERLGGASRRQLGLLQRHGLVQQFDRFLLLRQTVGGESFIELLLGVFRHGQRRHFGVHDLQIGVVRLIRSPVPEHLGNLFSESEFTEMSGAQAESEQFGIRQFVVQLAQFPLLGFDDVTRLHGAQRVGGAHVSGIFLKRLHGTLDPHFRALQVAELQVAVLSPVGRMILVADFITRLPQVARGLEGRIVPHRDAVPHAMLDEDMGRHVTRMGDRGGDIRILERGFECERGVQRVVKGMDHVMRCAGMIVVVLEQLERQRTRLHVDALAHVAGSGGAGQHGNRIEGFHFVIVGELFVQVGHRLHPGEPAFRHAAWRQGVCFRGLEEALLAFGRRLGEPLFAGRAKLHQRLTGPFVHRAEKGMLVGEGFTPIGQREVRVELLRLDERLARLGPAEAVQESHALDKVLLGFGRSGTREVESADFVQVSGLGGR